MGKNKVKISVVTVCYNAVDTIEETMLSVLNQTYDNIEYIIIDGGSTDGTVEIIKKYSDRLAYWVSEPDKGIYDAMNKGIAVATGDYINFMNAGDVFVKKDTIVESVTLFIESNVDVYFGDSIKKHKNGSLFYRPCPSNPELILHRPTYRHGSSFVKSTTHKKRPFDLSRESEFGFGLDYNQIWNMKADGLKFHKIDIPVMIYEQEGISNDPLRSSKINFAISHQRRRPTIKERIRQFVNLNKSKLGYNQLRSLFQFVFKFLIYILNGPIGNFPWWRLRKAFMRLLKIKLQKNTIINMGQYFICPQNLYIGTHTHINRGCILDARGGLTIGNNVSISYDVKILTGSHDCMKKNFPGIYLPIKIEDYVWIGAGATILTGVTVGKGSVVAAGAMVTKNVPPFTIVGGIPAKEIGKRPQNLDYKCRWNTPFC